MKRINKTKLNIRSLGLGRFSGVLMVFIVMFGFMYLYFVQSSIFNIVAREKVDKEISSVNSQVAVLESQYLKARGKVTIEFASRLGLEEDFNKMNFANVDNSFVKGGLSFLSDEI